ncbi:MAG: tetratricopeptide repeat protein, partial [Gemmatimonadaceae bacterium]
PGAGAASLDAPGAGAASLDAPLGDDARVDGLVHGAELAASQDDEETGLTSHLDLGFITGFETTGSDDTLELAAAGADIEPLADVEPTSLGALGGDADDLEFELQEDPGTALMAESQPAAPADSDIIELLPPPVESPDESAVAMPRAEHTYEIEALADPTDDATPAAPEPQLDHESPPEILAELEEQQREQESDIPPPDAPPVPMVERLRSEIERVPDNWDLHRLFGEALLEHGDREGGLAQFEVALLGYERDGDLRAASGIAEELVRVQPNSVRFHQKRVEYAVRANERPRLVAAYLALADCLLRDGEVNKSRAVYHRVLELAPDDARARSALRSVGTGDTPVPGAPRMSAPTGVPRRDSSATPAPVAPRAAANTPPSGAPADGYVNLSDWLREDEPERNTRMVADVNEPRDQEQADFAEMLEMFKRGVARNVDESDFESHYDLGVAYKEMGLLDEAIAEFQKALRGNDQRVRTYEALGQCFTEKGQYQIALTLLARALNDRTASDDTLVGVLYLLGIASEALGRWPDAQRFYERVFAVDIQFRDVADRLAAVERHAR